MIWCMLDDRTLADLAAKFRRFAENEAPKAPLYARLAQAVADDPAVLALAARARAGQPAPNLLFAAVQRHLLRAREEPLAAHYPEIAGDRSDDGRPAGDPWPRFRAFCLAHADTIRAVLETRMVQTNEVGRCALLLPALSVIWRAGREQPLGLIEFGASAGLNLYLDRYAYDYGDGRLRGDPNSTVRLSCHLRGTITPPPPDRPPPIAARTGLDLNPLDVTDPDDAGWLRALVWPGMAARVARLEAAIALAAADPPPLRAGDGIALLPAVLAEMPATATACVFHAHTLNQLPPPAARDAFEATLKRAAARRPIYRIGLEGAAPHSSLTLHRYDSAGVDSRTLAHCDAHGAWLEWL